MPDDAATTLYKQITKNIAVERQALQDRADDYYHHGLLAEKTIKKATDDYVATGIAYASMDFCNACNHVGLTQNFPKEYFKSLAAERKRPFVFAADVNESGWIGGSYRHVQYTQLTVPNSKSLKGVVSGLTLVAVNKPYYEADVTTAHSERLWRFNFRGPGIDVFKSFLETCRTNKVMRILLKV